MFDFIAYEKILSFRNFEITGGMRGAAAGTMIQCAIVKELTKCSYTVRIIHRYS